MNAHIQDVTSQPVATANPNYEDPALYGDLDVVDSAATLVDDEDDDEDPLVLELTRPYTFGGSTFEKLDLHGLESLKAGDLKRTAKLYMKLYPAANPATLESNMEYTFLIASRVLSQPLEFFDGLPARDAISLKTSIVGFLYGADGVD